MGQVKGRKSIIVAPMRPVQRLGTTSLGPLSVGEVYRIPRSPQAHCRSPRFRANARPSPCSSRFNDYYIQSMTEARDLTPLIQLPHHHPLIQPFKNDQLNFGKMTTNDLKEFEHSVIANIPTSFQRHQWITQQHEKLQIYQYLFYTTLSTLYREVTRCYINECYYASTTMAIIAMEAHLKANLYGLKPPETSLHKLITKTQEKGFITNSLAKRLLYIKDTIHNQIKHPYNIFHIGELGLYKVPRNSTWGPSKEQIEQLEKGTLNTPLPTSLTPQQAAEEAITLLLTLIKDYPLRISDPYK